MGRPRARHNNGTRRSASSKLTRATSSSSPTARVPLSQPGLDSVSESVANGDQASIKAEPPRTARHRRSRSWMSLSTHKDEHIPKPENGNTHGIDSRRTAETANGAAPSDGRSSRSSRWWWSKTRDTADPASGADSRVIEELLDSAEEEAAGLTGITSPRDAKVKRRIFSGRWRSSKNGEQRQPDPRTDALSASAIAAATRDADAAGDSKLLAVPERLLDSTDAGSTTRSAGSSTPDARTVHDGAGPDSSRPSSRQSATAKDDDPPRKPSRHRRGNSFLEYLGLAAKAAGDGTGDGSQEAGGTGRLRSRRGELPSKKADAAGATHKSTLSCFGMPQVADDEAGIATDDGLLIEGLTEGAIGMRNLCNTCFINSTLQCLRATPGLLQMLAPDLLADPSQLPSDLIEPLSAGPPALHLAEDAAEAASPEPVAPATEQETAATDAADEAGATLAPASAENAAPEAVVAAAPAAPVPGEVAAAEGAADSPQPEEQPVPPVDQAAAAAGDEQDCAAPHAAAAHSNACDVGDRAAKLADAEATACDAGPGSTEAAAHAACAAAEQSPDAPEAAPVPEDVAAEAAPAEEDGEHRSEEEEGEQEAAAPEEAAVAVEASKEEIARDLVQVMVQLAVGSGSDPVAPRQLYRDMAHNDMWAQFSDGGQHDSHELLRFVMSALHEVHDRVTEKLPYVELEDVPDEAPAAKAERLWQLLHAREASPVSDLFQGQLESRVTCNKCGSTFYTYEPFMDLSLSLFKEGKMAFFRGKTIDKLEDCFRVYTEDEKLEGNEAYFCPACKARHSATKALRIHRFPHCLVLHIKRFKGLNRTHYKLSSNVSFPLLGLNLAPFSTAGKGASRSGHEAPGLYDLYAVSNHTGSLDSGHYTAYVKVADPENEGEQKWLLLADDKVSDAQAESIVSAEAYMLFYVQRAQATTSEDE